MDAHNHHGSRNVLSVKAQECPVFSTTVACLDTQPSVLDRQTGKDARQGVSCGMGRGKRAP